MNKSFYISENLKLECSIAKFTNVSCKLDSNFELNEFKLAYKTFGNLNERKNNAILICHALNRRSICLWNKSNNKKRWLVVTNGGP